MDGVRLVPKGYLIDGKVVRKETEDTVYKKIRPPLLAEGKSYPIYKIL
jgi:hypothetical protein